MWYRKKKYKHSTSLLLLLTLLISLTLSVNIYLLYFNYGGHVEQEDEDLLAEFLVNTASCKIQETDIFVFENEESYRIPNCSYESLLSKFDDETQVSFSS